MSSNIYYLCVFTFLCVLNTCYSLECYKCNVTVSAKYDDPCKGIGSTVKCQDPAVCLSATYSYEDPATKLKQFTTVKSCSMKTGQECQLFLKAVKDSSPPTAKIEFNEKCFTCEEKGCNESSNAQINTLSSTLIVGLVCYIFSLVC